MKSPSSVLLRRTNVTGDGRRALGVATYTIFRPLRLDCIVIHEEADMKNRTLLAVAAMLSAPLAFGQADYPNKPSVIVLAIGAGSGTDLGLRMYADRLSRRLGQSFVVENKPGASTILGTEYGMRQTPTGYNLTSLFSTSTIVPSTHKVVPFDPVRDFM